MQLTKKEWRILEEVITRFVNDTTLFRVPHTRTADQTVAENLLSRMKLELKIAK